MKMNLEHPYTHIFPVEVFKRSLLILVLSCFSLFAFEWTQTESTAVYDYSWEFSAEEIDAFIENGTLISEQFQGHSIQFEGRSYPIYTVTLGNMSHELALVLDDKEIQTITSVKSLEDLGSLKDSLIDVLNVSEMSDFVSLHDMGDNGAMLEIMPVLPSSNGQIRIMKKGHIRLLPSGKAAITGFVIGDKDKSYLSKTVSLEQNLPDQFCALNFDHTGFYTISGQDLLDKNVDITQIDPDNLKILRWGNEIPIRVTSTNDNGNYIFAEDDFIQFYIDELINPYGDYRYNPFSKYDVAQLIWNEGYGKRFVQQNSVIVDTPNKFSPEDNKVFKSTLYYEKNQKFDQLSRLHEEELSHRYEHYFYSPYVSVGNSIEFPFELWNADRESQNNVEVTLRMQGLTYNVTGEMDHQISVLMNDRYLLTDEWEGQTPKLSSNEGNPYRHENLREGENTLRISVEGFQDNSLLDDRVYLDWIKVEYDREMIAHDNFLQFSPQFGDGRYLFEIQGFTSPTDILILKDEINWIRGYTVIPEDTVNNTVMYSVYFEDVCDGDEVYTLGCPGSVYNTQTRENDEFGVVSLDSIRYVDVNNDERYHEDQGDYVILTTDEFAEGAQALAEHKESMGFKSVVYNLDVLSDKFNYSNQNPYTIKQFLEYAYTTWSIQPHYVVLVGDAGYFPTILYQSAGALGSVLADTWYTDVDDDYVMEMSLGRLPVKTTDNLDSMIAKIKIHDNDAGTGTWVNRIGVVTGPQSSFRTNAQDFINKVSPDHMQVDRLYLYDSNADGEFNAGAAATDSLLSMMNYGISSLNYLGHGGGYTWDNKILPYDSFDLIQTQNTFLVNSLTCFSNSFSNNTAIGEMFVKHPKGAVSVLGSTGYGWLYSNDYLFQNLSKYLYHNRQSHGDSYRYGMIDFFFSIFGKNIGFYDHINETTTIYKHVRKSFFYQFCILGDPAAAIPELNEVDELTLAPKVLQEGDVVTINVPQSHADKGILDLVGVVDQKRKHPIQQKVSIQFENGEAQYTIPESDGFHDAMLQISYTDADENLYVATGTLSIDAPYISELGFYPQAPGADDLDSAFIQLKLESGSTVSQVELKVYQQIDEGGYYKVLPLLKIDDETYRSETEVHYYDENSFYTYITADSLIKTYYSGIYFVPVISNDDGEIEGDFYKLEPDYIPQKDISIYNFSIERGQGKLELINNSDEEVKVAVLISAQDSLHEYATYQDTVLTNDDVDKQYESGVDRINTFYLDYLPPYGAFQVELEIIPLDITDTDTNNNHKVITVDHKWISYTNHILNHNSDTLFVQDAGFIGITPNSSSSSEQAAYVNTYRQRFSLSPFGGDMLNDSTMYVQNTSGDDLNLTGMISRYDTPEDVFVVWYASDSSLCFRLPITSVDSLKTFPIDRTGYYVFAKSMETSEPQIQVNLNARTLLSGGYVSRNSEYSVMVSDNYGVHPMEYTWSVLLDDQEISEENISVTGGADLREFGYNFKLDIDEGEDHHLKVTASDLMGNVSETEEYILKYSSEAQLMDYGNFPNPFTVQTTFIYELTEQFDDLQIKIYTLSGQKIFTMSEQENAVTDLPLYNVGYHEVPWNGKDIFGNSVANGVYFYLIRGEINGKVIKSTGKIAKLR